jgi:hypothetical protein
LGGATLCSLAKHPELGNYISEAEVYIIWGSTLNHIALNFKYSYKEIFIGNSRLLTKASLTAEHEVSL